MSDYLQFTLGTATMLLMCLCTYGIGVYHGCDYMKRNIRELQEINRHVKEWRQKTLFHGGHMSCNCHHCRSLEEYLYEMWFLDLED